MKYEKITYPDGQISAKLDEKNLGNGIIKERINSYEDLIFVRSIMDAYEDRYPNIPIKPSIFIPCLFGQRSDRRFGKGQSFDLKIIAEILNSANFGKVEIFDPHSDIPLSLINRSYKIGPEEYVEKAIVDITKGMKSLVLISPDAGAYKKVFGYGERFNLPVGAAVKHRDTEGKINLQFIGDVKGKNCLIVDDLLDGGYTFHLLGEKLKEQGAEKVYLYISHAYFNKGVDFTPYIDHFYCTDSVKEINHPKVTQFKVYGI